MVELIAPRSSQKFSKIIFLVQYAVSKLRPKILSENRKLDYILA